MITRVFDRVVAPLRQFIDSAPEELLEQPPLADEGSRRGQAGPAADDEFARLALDLFALQFAHNEPYRRLCAARGVTPANVAHWTHFPAMPTAGFKELDVTCLPPRARTAVFHSSGTTGHRPSRHYHSPQSLEIYETSLWAWFRRSVGVCPDKLLILTPTPAHAPHSSLVHMFDTIRRRALNSSSVFLGKVEPTGGWSLDLEATLAALQRAAASGRRVLVLGTAFSYVHLLDHLAAQRVRIALPPGSRALETGGYKGRSRALSKSQLHSLLSARLGIPPTDILCEYGMSELSSQAYDQPRLSAKPAAASVLRHFRFPPWVRAQVVSPETGREVAEGETGLIRVVDLANVFSVLAVQTEDLGLRHADGFELLGRSPLAEPRGCSLAAA